MYLLWLKNLSVRRKRRTNGRDDHRQNVVALVGVLMENVLAPAHENHSEA